MLPAVFTQLLLYACSVLKSQYTIFPSEKTSQLQLNQSCCLIKKQKNSANLHKRLQFSSGRGDNHPILWNNVDNSLLRADLHMPSVVHRTLPSSAELQYYKITSNPCQHHNTSQWVWLGENLSKSKPACIGVPVTGPWPLRFPCYEEIAGFHKLKFSFIVVAVTFH